ncbi:MAG: PAS domain-containing protein, partial [Myxococcales bacterium]|nr:PAS domain-containing protein [Myxococcales bacterium]
MAMRELHQSREWFSTTLRSIGDAVVTTDAQARVTFMNGVAEELTRWSSGEAEGQPLTEVFRIVNESTRATVASPVEEALRDGAIVALANHTVLVRRDGSEVAIDDSAAPIRDARGDVTGAVLIFRDITGRRTAD